MLCIPLQMNKLILLVCLVAVAKANWVDQEGPRIRGLTCAKVLEEEEDHVDLVQAGAKVLGGQKSGPVSEKIPPFFRPQQTLPNT